MNSAPQFGPSMYPVQTPPASATSPLVTVVGGRDIIIDARAILDVVGTLTVEKP